MAVAADSSDPSTMGTRTPTYVAVEYPTCALQQFGEAFSSLSEDASTPTNYPGSLIWRPNSNRAPSEDNAHYVQGTGWVCSNGSVITADTLLRLPACANLTTPPLELYECLPRPNLIFSAIYIAIGAPLFLLCMLWILHKHRVLAAAAHPDTVNRHCLPPCHPVYAHWNLLFSKAASSHPNYSPSTTIFFMRLAELEHSFLCFFFLSRADPFSWPWRAFLLICDQVVNFSLQTLWTMTFDEAGGAATISSTLANIVCTLATAVGYKILFPTRSLMGEFFLSTPKSCKRRGLQVWIGFNLIAMSILVAVLLSITSHAGEQGGTAPNPGASLMVYSVVAYVAAIPYHLLLELVTPFVLCKVLSYVCCCCGCGQWVAEQWKKSVDEYTQRFCAQHLKEARTVELGVTVKAITSESGVELQILEVIPPSVTSPQSLQPPSNAAESLASPDTAETKVIASPSASEDAVVTQASENLPSTSSTQATQPPDGVAESLATPHTAEMESIVSPAPVDSTATQAEECKTSSVIAEVVLPTNADDEVVPDTLPSPSVVISDVAVQVLDT